MRDTCYRAICIIGSFQSILKEGTRRSCLRWLHIGNPVLYMWGKRSILGTLHTKKFLWENTSYCYYSSDFVLKWWHSACTCQTKQIFHQNFISYNALSTIQKAKKGLCRNSHFTGTCRIVEAHDGVFMLCGLLPGIRLSVWLSIQYKQMFILGAYGRSNCLLGRKQ